MANVKYRRKLIPKEMLSDKEELYDQNLHLKMYKNEVVQENIRLKTKIAIL